MMGTLGTSTRLTKGSKLIARARRQDHIERFVPVTHRGRALPEPISERLSLSRVVLCGSDRGWIPRKALSDRLSVWRRNCRHPTPLGTFASSGGQATHLRD